MKEVLKMFNILDLELYFIHWNFNTIDKRSACEERRKYTPYICLLAFLKDKCISVRHMVFLVREYAEFIWCEIIVGFTIVCVRLNHRHLCNLLDWRMTYVNGLVKLYITYLKRVAGENLNITRYYSTHAQYFWKELLSINRGLSNIFQI